MLTIEKRGALYVALCGKTVVFSSLERSSVLAFVARWNSDGDESSQ